MQSSQLPAPALNEPHRGALGALRHGAVVAAHQAVQLQRVLRAAALGALVVLLQRQVLRRRER